DECAAAQPAFEGGAQRVEIGGTPAGKTTAQREDLARRLRIQKIGTRMHRGGIRRRIDPEKGRLVVRATAIPHHGAGARRSAGRKRAKRKCLRAQPRLAVGAARAAGEAECRVRRAEAVEHLRNVEALAADLKRLALRPLGFSGAPCTELERALREQVA